MKTQTEALNLIHEQLQKLWLLGDKAAELANPALDAIKEALAQPEQEPVACIRRNKHDEYRLDVTDNFKVTNLPVNVELLLYTTPPQRKPLTREQRIQIVKDNTVQGYHGDYFDAWGIIDDVEAAHGIKE